MSMRFIAAGAFALGLGANSVLAGDPGLSLTILHINDAESQLLGLGDANEYGNAARFIEKMNDLRAAYPLNLVITSGDNFLAGPEFNASVANGTSYDALALGAAGFDALCLGNHDFDFGPAYLAEFVQNFPAGQTFLSCNIDFSGEPALQAQVDAGRIAPSKVVTVDGVDVAIIGATTPNLPFISSPGACVVDADVAGSIQAEIDRLAALGVDHVIVTSHLQGVAEDLSLISQLRGVDVAIAGGGDDLLANPSDVLIPGDEAAGAYPLVATDADGNDVPVISTKGSYGYIGRCTIDFDVAGNVLVAEGGPVRVVDVTVGKDGVSGDASIQASVVDPVATYVAELANTVVATSEVELDGRRPQIRSEETNEGNLITDAFIWQATELAKQFGVPAPKVAFANGGGIRNDSIIPAGPVSALDTFDMLPFSNFVTVIPEVSRETLVAAFENCYSRVLPGGGSAGSGTGRFGQLSGAVVVFNADRPEGERIISAVLSDGTVICEAGQVVDGPAVPVVTVDFLANGGDQYPFAGLPYQIMGVSYQQALQNFLVDGLGGLITAAEYPVGGEGRIVRRDVAADVNGDGVVNGADLALIFADWGQCTSSGNCLSDITGDGMVDGADLGYVAGFWSR